MATTSKPRSTFGEKLRTELDSQGTSIRKLSRQINSKNPELARRNLSRWISGGTRPTQAKRRQVAEALGLDPSYFEEDDEEDPLMRDLRRVLRRHGVLATA